MTIASRVLLIDDEPTLLFALKSSFNRAGWRADTACTLAEATQLLQQRAFDLIVCDVRLGTESGFNLLPHVKAHSGAALLFLTAYATVPDAVRAIHGGAFDYLTKPVSFEHLLRVATRILLDKQSASDFSAAPQPAPACDPTFFPISEEAWRALAASDEALLLLGAPGAGKRTFAHFLHTQSRRRHGPCLTVDCSGRNAVQLSRELFGEANTAFGNSHVVGAAACAAAHGGTLVLNHAEEIPASLQRGLAQVIATGVIPHGDPSQPVPADIRVIACAQTPPLSAIAPGVSFLKTVPGIRTIQFPEMRDCHEAEDVVAEVSFQQLPRLSIPVTTGHQIGSSRARTMQELERLHLEKTLAQVQGNRTHAAELLGISVRTMRNKIRQYDLAPRRYA